MFPDDIHDLARRVIEGGAVKGLMISTAESCTGGLVAGALTAIAGSSAVFERGFVTYSNDAKASMLGVPDDLFLEHGAVSEAVARAMAEGAMLHSRARVAVSVTGIAGPGGGSAGKPVGLVHFGVAGPAGIDHVERRFADNGREAIRMDSLRLALGLLLDQVSG